MNSKASPPSTNTSKKCGDLLPYFPSLESRLAGEHTVLGSQSDLHTIEWRLNLFTYCLYLDQNNLPEDSVNSQESSLSVAEQCYNWSHCAWWEGESLCTVKCADAAIEDIHPSIHPFSGWMEQDCRLTWPRGSSDTDRSNVVDCVSYL
jgi:hypothetical protein